MYITYCVSMTKVEKRGEPGELISLRFTAIHEEMMKIVSNAVVAGLTVEVWTTQDSEPHCTHPDYVEDSEGLDNDLDGLLAIMTPEEFAAQELIQIKNAGRDIGSCEECKAAGFHCDYDDERVHCSILS